MPHQKLPDHKASRNTAVTALKFNDQALSPEQQRFNKLLIRTENLALKIEAARTLGDTHRPLFSKLLGPLETQRNALMRDMALWLDARLQRGGLSAKQKRDASEIICHLAAGLAMMGDEAMQQLHDAHSDISMAEQEHSAMAEMQGIMEGMLGESLGDQENYASVQEMLQASLEKIRQREEAEQEARATAKGGRKKTVRQQQTEQQTLDADGALRTIYRQLVSALHPDRESDPHERERKTALMKDVNTAYEKRDLLVLLQLQLHIEQADGEKVATLAREKVMALTLLLKERVAVLTRELQDIQMRTLAEFELPPYAPLNATTLKRHLQHRQQGLEDAIEMMMEDLQRVPSDAALKRWLTSQLKMNQTQFDLDSDAFF